MTDTTFDEVNYPVSMNHTILLQRLQQNFGVIGAVLQWLTSFLSGRTQLTIYD